MLNKTLTLLLISIFLSLEKNIAQIPFRVMWYNVENLFDTVDDPERDDNEFLPSGNRRWTNKRYYHKLQQLSKVIHAAGEWDTPALIGLCEVENDTVMTHLIKRTSLRYQDYRYCISESGDSRGIRVALLYQRDKFRLINHRNIRISDHTVKRSIRPLLHVWGEVASGDTLDIFLAHFPSRYGGEKESERGRFAAASALRKICDSILSYREKPMLLIMGDFNDEPNDKSIQTILQAYPYPSGNSEESGTYLNLIPYSEQKWVKGTHKYQGNWSQLDQIMINRQLVDNSYPFRLVPASVRIFSPPFLLIPDKTWRGVRPKRTYYGFKYEGGYSDHLPLIADFYIYLW